MCGCVDKVVRLCVGYDNGAMSEIVLGRVEGAMGIMRGSEGGKRNARHAHEGVK